MSEAWTSSRVKVHQPAMQSTSSLICPRMSEQMTQNILLLSEAFLDQCQPGAFPAASNSQYRFLTSSAKYSIKGQLDIIS